jgi:hypothetical protein
LRRLFGMAGDLPVEHIGGSLAEGALVTVEDRALWSRFGL